MSTPKRTIYENVSLERERSLPISGKSFVKVGDNVTSDEVILSTEIKGELYIIRLSEKLGIDSNSIEHGLKIKVGDAIKEYDEIFFRKGIFSFLDLKYQSQVEGIVEFISFDSGHIGVRLAATKLSVNAFIPGIVRRVEKSKTVLLSSKVGLLQGIVGYGGENTGKIRFIETNVDKKLEFSDIENLQIDDKPIIVCGGAGFTKEFFDLAKQKGVVGIVTASLDSADVSSILETSVFGNSPVYNSNNPIVILIEGFGNINLSNRAIEFFRNFQDKTASISGITQIRAGAIRPELLVHEPDEKFQVLSETTVSFPKIGDLMRVVRGTYFGKVGKIKNLPREIQLLASGVETYVAEIEIDNESIKVSLANLESI